MPKPTVAFGWATDAAYSGDATANKIEPPSGLRAQGWERADRPGAQHVNHLLNAHGQWLGWAETEIDTAIAAIDALEARVRPDLTTFGAYAGPQEARPAWDAVLARPHWELDSTAAAAWDIMRCHSNRGVLSWSWAPGRNLPFSCTVTTVRCYVQMGATGIGPGDRMLLRVSTLSAATTVSAVVGEDEAADIGTPQLLEVTGLNIPLQAVNIPTHPGTGALTLTATLFGRAGTAPINDEAYLCEVRYTPAIIG